MRMVVSLYLTSAVESDSEFKVVKRSNGKDSWDEHQLSGMKISKDDGRWMFSMRSPEHPIPEVFCAYVEEVEIYERIPRDPKRASGIYEVGDATAALDRNGDAGTYGLGVRGKSLQGVLELYRLIRAGTILPKESWDAPQIIPPVVPPNSETATDELEST